LGAEKLAVLAVPLPCWLRRVWGGAGVGVGVAARVGETVCVGVAALELVAARGDVAGLAVAELADEVPAVEAQAATNIATHTADTRAGVLRRRWRLAGWLIFLSGPWMVIGDSSTAPSGETRRG